MVLFCGSISIRHFYLIGLIAILVLFFLSTTPYEVYAKPPTPVITLNPTIGNVGIQLTVEGGNFKKNDVATITYDGVVVASVSTGKGSTGGTFSTSFTVPSSTAGSHIVQATDTHGSTASAKFTTISDVTLTSNIGAVGSIVTISGTGYAGSSTVTIKFNGTVVPTIPSIVTTNSSGSFSATFTVPPSIAGAHEVQATDASSNTASDTFTTIPDVTLTPDEGAVGSIVTISGTGYAGSSTVTIKFNGTAVSTIPATVTTDSSGSFSATFTVPPTIAGSHTVQATDTHGTTTSETFTVQVLPQTIALTPNIGEVGSIVTISGTGYAGSSTVTIKSNGTAVPTIPSIVTTNSSGSFSATFTVPPSIAGAHEVQATDASSNTASTTFTTIPDVTLTPKTRAVGSIVTISGTGYAGSSTVTIKSNGTVVPTTPSIVTTNSSGSFSATFTVPPSIAGAHEVQATDGINSDFASLRVRSLVTTDTRVGAVGSIVTISGTGYAGSSTVTIKFNGTAVPTIPSIVTTNSSGSFSATFTVPVLDNGTYIILVHDASSNVSARLFTITPLTIPTTTVVGGSPPRGFFASYGAFSAQDFLNIHSLSQSVKYAITNQDPSTPLAPSDDPSVPYYPLQIDDKKYLIARYVNTIQTVTEKQGVPVNLEFRSYDTTISHLELNMNFEGQNTENAYGDTSIVYDKYKPLQIIDPHGFFSDVKIEPRITENLVMEFDVSITFAKPMPKSNIFAIEWNDQLYTSITRVLDAIEVSEPRPSTSIKDDNPNNLGIQHISSKLTENIAPKSPENDDSINYIKEWGGYSPTSISDSQLLAHFGIKAEHIPPWFMNIVKWVVSGNTSEKEFEDAVNFMYKNKIIK